MNPKNLLAIAALGFATLAIAPQAEARSYYRSHCAPYKVSTCEVARGTQCRTAYDACGNRYSYTVTSITYRDYYSDGSSRTYTRTFRS